MKPLLIDLFCGLGGWTRAFLDEGWDAIGLDIERHDYGTGGYPGQLVLQDVCALEGRQISHADCIVASSPCQEFSYRAMPWKRAKALGPPILGIKLFWQAFRLQREIEFMTGRKVPLIAENVCGAQKWIGRAAWHYGSFYLWGDVPALMPTPAALKNPGFRFDVSGRSFQTESVTRLSLQEAAQLVADDERARGNEEMARAIEDRAARPDIKNRGGSWFNIAHNTTSGVGNNPDGRKVKGISWSGSDKPGYKPQGLNTTAAQRYRDGIKDRDSDGYERDHPQAFGWKAPRTTSKCDSRKAASAMIAMIPYPLAQHIARVMKPDVPARSAALLAAVRLIA